MKSPACLGSFLRRQVLVVFKPIAETNQAQLLADFQSSHLNPNSPKMMKLVFVVLLVVLAVASAQLLIPTAYGASGAYGAHNAFAVSSQARVDVPRRDAIAIGAVPLGLVY